MAEIFTRKFSEVSGGRFDPLWLLFNPKIFLKNTPFCVEALGKSIVSAKTGFAAGKENQTNRDGIIQIRPTNLDEQGILKFDKNIYVPKDISTEYLLQKGEVLFNNTNSQELVGKTAYFDLDGNFTSSNHITRIQTDTNRLLPQYLAIVLNVYQRNKVFFNICVNWNNQSGVNVELLKSLLIPLPPLSTQQHIIDLMNKAYKAKKEKENKAKELLDSIDSYLLEELGIILPLRANNTLDSRIYTQKISALSGSRFDANYHQKYYIDLEKSLLSSPYPLVNLASLINNFKKGIEVGSNEYSQNKEIPFIRVSDITNNGIDFSNVQKFISASLFENLKAYKPKENELLYSKDGTIGICLKADVSRDYVISGGILRLELKAEVDKDFLCFLLGSYMMNVFANRASIGAVIKHLNVGEFLNLKIPLPPLAIQTQIASRLKNSKFQALSLEKEAKEILHKAKIDIETLLLTAGGGGVTLAFSFEAFISTQMHYFDKMTKIWNEKEYSVVRLGEILSFVASGSTPESKGEDYEKNGIYHFLRLVDFNDGLEIDFNNALFVKEYIYKNTLSRVQLKNNDILFGIAGSVGKVAQYKSDKMAVVNQAIAILRFQKGVFADFMCYLLASNVIQNQVQRLKRPVAQPNISVMELKGIKIPLPPLTEQERIAKEISQRKARAKALKQEAKELLENAKKEVGHIILGG